MRPGFLNTCLASLYFLIASAASPRDKYREAAEHLPEVVKSVTQDLSKEPSCDELRAMWRFSKRQSRAAESTNEIPTYRDPFAYNVWEDHASIRSVGGGKMRRPLVYGRLVHNGYQRPRIQEAPVPERIRGFEDIARMFGTVHMPKVHSRRKPTSIRLVGGNGLGQMQMNAQTGSFQHLKELIQSERARELHEQKMSEESAARESALQYQRMMAQDGAGTGLVPYSHNRARPHLDPVVNFPDVLAPSNDYYTNYNYMQRAPYPDSLMELSVQVRSEAAGRYFIPAPWTPLPLASGPLDLLSSLPRLSRSTSPQSPSAIDQEISRLTTDLDTGPTDTVRSPPTKRDVFSFANQDYGDYGEDFIERVQETNPFDVYSQLEYIPSFPQENALFTLEEEDIDDINIGSPFEDYTDLGLLTMPDSSYETDAYDYELNGNADDKVCAVCVIVFGKVMRYLKVTNASEVINNNQSFYSESGPDKPKDNGFKEVNEKQGCEENKSNGNLSLHEIQNDVVTSKENENRYLLLPTESNNHKGSLSDDINHDLKMSEKQDEVKVEDIIKKDENNIEMFTRPHLSVETVNDKKKTNVLGFHKKLIYPQLLSAVNTGVGQNRGDNEIKRNQMQENNELGPSKPPNARQKMKT